MQNLAILYFFYKDNENTLLCVLVLGVINFHLSSYSEIKVKRIIIEVSMISECLNLFEILPGQTQVAIKLNRNK